LIKQIPKPKRGKFQRMAKQHGRARAIEELRSALGK
jgi:hypothetical protein